jgi:hypothetical protein
LYVSPAAADGGQGILKGNVVSSGGSCPSFSFSSLTLVGYYQQDGGAAWGGTLNVSGMTTVSPDCSNTNVGYINQTRDPLTGQWHPSPATFTSTGGVNSASGSFWGTYTRIGDVYQGLIFVSVRINGGPLRSNTLAIWYEIPNAAVGLVSGSWF